MSAITTEKKLKVINLINKNDKATNKGIAKALDVKASQVSSVRYWYGVKGEAYLNQLEEERTKLLNAFELYEDEFANKGGVEKQKARELIVKCIKETLSKRGKVLTLPCADWFIEEMIQEQVSKSFNYVACERNLGTFIKMAQKAMLFGKKNKLVHGEISEEIFEAVTDQYLHIIADYCGTLSKVKKELTYACSNNIVQVGGTISVTLFKARTESKMVKKLNGFKADLTGEEVRNNDNESAIKMFFKSLTSITDFEIVGEYCYADTSPMILIVLKRTK